MNHNINICVFYWSQEIPAKGSFNPPPQGVMAYMWRNIGLEERNQEHILICLTTYVEMEGTVF